MTDQTEMPERIWAAECRQTQSTMWWPDDAGGVGVEYIRADMTDTQKKTKKRSKTLFSEVKIESWQPTREGQPWVAMFRGLPMIFKAPTEAEAVSSADNWRTEEMAKELRKIENAKAASERMKARTEKVKVTA